VHPVAGHAASARVVSGIVNFGKSLQTVTAHSAMQVDERDFDTTLDPD